MTNIAKIHVICGPTASGKSALALSLAQKENGVIINADSQQVYRDLRILTARPTAEEEARAPHRLYGFMPAHEMCSAGKWLAFAKMEIDWALSEGKTPVVCGGTGLYLKALLEGLAEIPEIDPGIRAQAESDYGVMGKEAFSERLQAADPQFFTRLKVYDRQRLVRAYAVWLGTGKSLSWWQARGATPPYAADRFEITKVEIPREELYRRCDARFIKMVEAGAVEEVRSLCPPLEGGQANAVSRGGYGKTIPAPPDSSSFAPSELRRDSSAPPQGGGIYKTIGVPELSAYIRGEIPLDEAVARASQATRNYAKRQLTWFRRQLKVG